MKTDRIRVHPTAICEEGARIGAGSTIWHHCHLRAGARLGKGVSLGKDVYIDAGVTIGEGSRIQNGVSVYRGVKVARRCFIGPHVAFTNDLRPRVGLKDWRIIPTTIAQGASIGAGAIVLCGVRIGAYAMIGAGAIVTVPVPAFHQAVGAPARADKMVCACGQSDAPLGTPLRALLRPCCRRNMNPSAYREAGRWVRARGRSR